MTSLSRTLPPARLLIGERFLTAGSAGVITHVNPATGRPQAEVPLAGPTEVHEAVAAAKAASQVWRRTPPAQRRDVLLKLAQLIAEHATEFGRLATLENGTAQKIAFRGAMQAEAWTRYYAGWADKLEGQLLSTTPGERLDYTLPEPYGVIGIIITWNGPLISLGMKAAPALAAGNAVVIKPAEFTPFCAGLFGELALKAGVPPGVINIVPGSVQAGEALVAHPDVAKISFTGGPVAARRIMAAAAEQLKPLIFELGGKSANLVFADAPLERVAREAVFWGVSLLSGQGCALPTRLLVQRSVYPQVLEMVVENAKALKVGDPMDPASDMGPVVNAQACERILSIIEKAKTGGAGRLVAGGQRLGGPLAEGYYIEPTVFADVDPHSSLAQNEVFGPVLSVIPFDDEAHAVHIANATAYGLAAYIQTRDVNRVHRLAGELHAGSVYVNGGSALTPGMPFGGDRLSGFGKEGGKAGLDEFLRTKHVALQNISA